MTNETTQLRIIWFALLMSIAIYGVVAFLTVPIGAQPFDAAFANPIILVLHILGFSMFAMSFVMSSMILKRSGNPRPAMMIRWALIESAAVFGLLSAFMGRDFRLFLPLAALAIGGMVLAFPTAGRPATP